MKRLTASGLILTACLWTLAVHAEQPRADVDSSTLKNESGVLPDRAAHAGVDANLFVGHSWYTPPPAPVQRVKPVQVARKPTAPPLPYKMLGSYEQEGVPTTYYLVRGDRVYDVAVGDTVDENYSVDGVKDGNLMFTYLPLKTSQGLRLGERK